MTPSPLRFTPYGFPALCHVLASSGRFQVFHTFLETPHLLFDGPELYIQCLVKLHKSIDLVVNLLKAVFHTGESFLHILYNRNNRSVVCLERSDAPLHCGQARFDGFFSRSACLLGDWSISICEF